VSSRTIERDLSALQQSGVPIWAEPGRTGGYCLDARHTLPPLGLTVDEALTVMVALGMLAGGPFGATAGSALRKVLAVTDDDRTYTVKAVFPAGGRPSGAQPPWLADGVTLPGRVLRVVGLEMPSLDPDRSVLLHVRAA
jgi:predicted DNA-binding transcriptional regulator YafY